MSWNAFVIGAVLKPIRILQLITPWGRFYPISNNVYTIWLTFKFTLGVILLKVNTKFNLNSALDNQLVNFFFFYFYLNFFDLYLNTSHYLVTEKNFSILSVGSPICFLCFKLKFSVYYVLVNPLWQSIIFNLSPWPFFWFWNLNEEKKIKLKNTVSGMSLGHRLGIYDSITKQDIHKQRYTWSQNEKLVPGMLGIPQLMGNSLPDFGHCEILPNTSNSRSTWCLFLRNFSALSDPWIGPLGTWTRRKYQPWPKMPACSTLGVTCTQSWGWTAQGWCRCWWQAVRVWAEQDVGEQLLVRLRALARLHRKGVAGCTGRVWHSACGTSVTSGAAPLGVLLDSCVERKSRTCWDTFLFLMIVLSWKFLLGDTFSWTFKLYVSLTCYTF